MRKQYILWSNERHNKSTPLSLSSVRLASLLLCLPLSAGIAGAHHCVALTQLGVVPVDVKQDAKHGLGKLLVF